MHFINYVIQPNKKYNIILEELIGVLREGVWPPPNHSRIPPGGFWFLVAAALSNCKNPSEKYVYSVYMCWYRNKLKIDKALGM